MLGTVAQNVNNKNKNRTHFRYLIWAFLSANSFTMSLMFHSRLRAFSMERIASPDSLFCNMVPRKSFLMSFSFEKERSAEATVTGKVRKRTKMVHMSLKLDVMELFSTIK